MTVSHRKNKTVCHFLPPSQGLTRNLLRKKKNHGRRTEEVRFNLSFLLSLNLGSQARVLMSNLPILHRACIGAIAGGVAGGFTNATLHPIDTVKTRLQMKGASTMYKGPVDVVRKVIAQQGLSGLYRGLPAAIVGSTISSSVYFGMYELGKGVLGTLALFPSPSVPPLAAAMGNIASSAILVPKEVIKQRMQAGAVGNSMQVLIHTVQSEGVSGLYAGYSAALLRNLPSNMLSFSVFEYLKAGWLQHTKRDSLEPWQSLLSGACAGAVSAALTTPLDVAKTRLMTQARLAVSTNGIVASAAQAEAAARAQAIAAYTYGGVVSTLQRICREEGPSALMNGMLPRLLYSTCFSAVGFLSFETCRMLLLRHHFDSTIANIHHPSETAAVPPCNVAAVSPQQGTGTQI